ncbi:hypothetical protein CEXT_157701 [Caerostris extrusa]|uniref:Ycf15 n=1 Tax=Caerostris extrusa TaxID=172846 RepID=A0AAV4PSH3_CAEEX|nr:hypothetical protein CEXT_157701 [Caerostris extrusa]
MKWETLVYKETTPGHSCFFGRNEICVVTRSSSQRVPCFPDPQHKSLKFLIHHSEKTLRSSPGVGMEEGNSCSLRKLNNAEDAN